MADENSKNKPPADDGQNEVDQELPVEIKGLILDPSSNAPIVILRDHEQHNLLPIWIGVFEANAIALKLEGVESPRPMTHDLLESLLKALGGKLEKVIISDLKEKTFYARLHVRQKGGLLDLDARPSDAIALALRVKAPVVVLESVMKKALAADLIGQESDEERLKKWLEEISPEELGKYTM